MYISKFDLLKGYWQIPLTDRAKEISAFTIPGGLYQYQVIPFGLKNAPGSFQHLMHEVKYGLPNTDVYIDDVIVFSDNWEDHMIFVRNLFARLYLYHLTVNLPKSEFGKASVIYLGLVVGHGKVAPIEAKVQAIHDVPPPTTKKALMRFLGMAGYYRKFCRNFSQVVQPLTNMLRKSVAFTWSLEAQNAFDQVKAVLISSPVLFAPDFMKPFRLCVDASDVGIGAVLLQPDENNIDHPVSYYSCKLKNHQLSYSTIEKEALGLLSGLKHFEVYLSNTCEPTIVYCDHNPLTFLQRMKNTNQRLLRWCLSLQEYNVEIVHIKGKNIVIADTLSRV